MKRVLLYASSSFDFFAKSLFSCDHYDSSRDDTTIRADENREIITRNNSDLSWKLKIDYCAE